MSPTVDGRIRSVTKRPRAKAPNLLLPLNYSPSSWTVDGFPITCAKLAQSAKQTGDLKNRCHRIQILTRCLLPSRGGIIYAGALLSRRE